MLEEALALWRGPPLAEFSDAVFAQGESRRLEERRLGAVEQRIAADLDLGRHADVVSEVEALVLQHPLRENLRALQMLALYRAGRQADALAAYQEARAALVGELGLDPSESLVRLEQAILRHDRSLDLSEPAVHDASEPVQHIAAAIEATPTRKVVSAVFCEVVVSTLNGGRLDPERRQPVLPRYFEAATAVLGRHGGTVEKFIDDAVVAVFGVPVLHEDDALRALRAAVELRAGMLELNRGLESEFRVRVAVRIGVGTGEVVTGTDGRLATGDVLNAAARLQQAAAPGEILIGPDTLALVRDAAEVEELRLESATTGQPAVAYRLTGFEPRAPRIPRRLDVPMVGRTRERALLTNAFAGAVERACCSLVTLHGTAGVGKSRLAREFLAGIDARVVEGRCLSYGEGLTYSPVVDIVTQLEDAHHGLLEDDPAVGAAIASLRGESATPTTPDEIAWSFRKLLEASARERPLVVVFDDVQWGEPTFLDLVEHMAYLSRDAPIMLLCLARPELLERRPGWTRRSVEAITIALEPLEAAEVDELIEHLLNGEELEQQLGERIRTAAQGNPLFVEEMLAIVHDSHHGEVLVPPTIKALLAARLDQLDPQEREILGYGAVEGELFHRGAIETLATSSRSFEGHLVALVRQGLVRPDRSQILRDDAYRFCHLLIRDTAYDALPKATRSELHERYATWLELDATDLVEHDEIVGYHLEQAYNYRQELACADAQTESLGQRAGAHLAAAGLRASNRGDYNAVVSLVERALALGVTEPRERVRLGVELGKALWQTGRVAESETLLLETRNAAIDLGEKGLATEALVHSSLLRMVSDPEVGSSEIVPVAEEAIRTFEELHDSLGLAVAGQLLGDALLREGRTEASFAAFDQALVYADAAGDQIARRYLTLGLARSLSRGSTTPSDAIGRLEDLRSSNRDDHLLDAALARFLCLVLARAGRFDESRRLLDQSTPILGGADETQLAWGSRWLVAEAKELAGDYAGAEQELLAQWLRYRDARRQETDARALRATAELALLYSDQGRWAEAADCLSFGADQSEAAYGKVYPSAYGKVYSPLRFAAQARLAAYLGECSKAIELAGLALGVTEGTDSPDRHARVWLALAEVQRAAGHATEADAAATKALELYEQNGNVVAAARVRAAATKATN